MSELLAGTKKKGEGLIDELHAKKRVAIVDWKEHPIEVMACLDQIGGKAWRKDAERWEFTESIDLDRCLPDKFLPACAGPFEHLGLSLLSFDRDSDEAIFTVVPTTAVDATLSSVKKRGVKIARVRPAATKKTKIKREADETRKARAELEQRIAAVRTTDGAVLRDFAILYVVRLVLDSGAPTEEVRALLDFALTNELTTLEEQYFRTHGPHFDGELLGGAFLVGRGPEFVRALAHVFSLGERGKTALWKVFLGRDLAATWKRGATSELDALLTAPKKKYSAAAKKYLTASWSSSSRGMRGARVSFLVTGLAAFRDEKLDVGDTLEKYVARTLLPAPKTRALPKALSGLPKCVSLGNALGAARDASHPPAEYITASRAFETWVRESMTYAAREKSGMYLRAVPETAVHVAVSAYASGASVEVVRAWLAFAVDLEIARCKRKYAEDSLVFQTNLRDVAGAAMILDRGSELASAWREGRTTIDWRDRVVCDALLAWLEGKKAPVAKEKPSRRVPKAIVEVLEARDAAAIEKLVRTPTVIPVRWPKIPWPGPFSAFVTALVMKLPNTPRAAKGATMEEFCGREPQAAPALAWPKPRTKLSLDAVRGIALDAIRRIDIAAEPIRCADDCLLVARCVHALGAPIDEVKPWLHRSVDFAKGEKHLDEDLVGAARLVGREQELRGSIDAFGAKTKSAEHVFAEALRAYASGERVPAPTTVLKQRFFFYELVKAAHSAQAGDVKTMRNALGRAPWQHRNEWTGVDERKRPPDLSWFVMALAAETGGMEGIPPSTLPLVDEELIRTLRA